MALSGYMMRTTRNGREYVGRSDFPALPHSRFPHEALACLVCDAVEIETTENDKSSVEHEGPQGHKRVASPTPLEITQKACTNPPAPLTNIPSTPIGSGCDTGLTLKPQRNNGSHLRRKKQKQSKMHEQHLDTVARRETPVESTLLCGSFGAQTTGYCGLIREEPHPHLSLQGFRDAGYTVVHWRGVEALPILDDAGLVYAVFAGRPRSTDYLEYCHRLYVSLDAMNMSTRFLPDQLSHQRGKYPTADFGITADQGLPEPKNHNVPANVSRGAELLSTSSNMERILNFCDTSFQKWAPKLHAYYKQTMDALGIHPKYKSLKRVGSRSVFSSMSLNYGRSVVTVPHRDYKNLAFGWCAIVALGEFDPIQGGHLVLHEPRLVVEFPAGSAALIPSAVLTHSNTLLYPGDRRASVTFYNSGSLFRFVENGFQTLASVKAKDEVEYKRRQAQLKGLDVNGKQIPGQARWDKGLALYSTLDQLSVGVVE